jgi:uncharacterized protein
VRPFSVEGLVMLDWIGPQLPWWVTGPGVGLCVVALYGLINARLGVSGAWLATIAPVEGWRPEPWRRTFLLALVGGSLIAALMGPPVVVHGYGRLSELLGPVALVPVLLLVGVALGYGSRWAGGGRLPGQPGDDGDVLLGRRARDPGPARTHRRDVVTRGVRWSVLVVGATFGFLLTVSGLGDYDTIHDGLLLRNPYIFLMMVSAMAVAFVGLAVLRRLGRTRYAGPLSLPHARIERRHVYGGAVFGVGFGVGATCPGMTVVMTTTGGLYGLVVLVGLLGGLWLRGRLEQRQRQPLSTEPTVPAGRRVTA